MSVHTGRAATEAAAPLREMVSQVNHRNSPFLQASKANPNPTF